MEWLSYAGLFGIGFSGGLVTAAGVFALITVLGIVPRMAGATRTALHVRLYESAIIAGGSLADIWDVFALSGGLSAEILTLGGLGSGVFVGSLVMALAETLNVVPIFCRRLRITRGVSFLVAAIAAGKWVGAWIYFAYID